MKVIHTFNYEPLNTVQSKYFFGYTGGENPKRIATSKQLWKMLKIQMDDTKRVIDEMTNVSLPMSLDNMATKIKLLTELLESALPKLQNAVEVALEIKSA